MLNSPERLRSTYAHYGNDVWQLFRSDACRSSASPRACSSV